MVSLDDRPWSDLVAVSPARFRVDGSPLEIEFDARPGQRANVVALREGGSTSVLLRAVDPGATFAGVPFFLRGSMNQWNVSQRMREAGAHHYTATMALPAGLHGFKLGSADWQAVDFGGTPDADVVVPGQSQAMAAVGANLRLQIERDGNYRFTLDASRSHAPVIMVTAAP